MDHQALQSYTRKTLTKRAALLRELNTIRKRGYAVDDEEIEEGLRCVGAAVRNHTGNAVASISIAGPAFRIGRARVPALGRLVVAAALQLSMNLGYYPAHETASAAAARSQTALLG